LFGHDEKVKGKKEKEKIVKGLKVDRKCVESVMIL